MDGKWISFLQMLHIKRKKTEQFCPLSSWELFDFKQNCRCLFQSDQSVRARKNVVDENSISSREEKVGDIT